MYYVVCHSFFPEPSSYCLEWHAVIWNQLHLAKPIEYNMESAQLFLWIILSLIVTFTHQYCFFHHTYVNHVIGLCYQQLHCAALQHKMEYCLHWHIYFCFHCLFHSKSSIWRYCIIPTEFIRQALLKPNNSFAIFKYVS